MTYNGKQVDLREYTALHMLSLLGLWCVTVALWIYLGALLTHAESPAERMRLMLSAVSVPLWFALLWLVRNLVGLLVCGRLLHSRDLCPNAAGDRRGASTADKEDKQ